MIGSLESFEWVISLAEVDAVRLNNEGRFFNVGLGLEGSLLPVG